MNKNQHPVANENTPPQARDLAATRPGVILMWGVPIAAILSTNFGLWAPQPTLFIIAGALIWMGIGCLLNARRCGRVHCRFTGPWFLLAGLVPLMVGFGILDLSTGQWNIFSAVTTFGALGIWYFSEKILGTYRG